MTYPPQKRHSHPKGVAAFAGPQSPALNYYALEAEAGIHGLKTSDLGAMKL
jgi:hypothetical protein